MTYQITTHVLDLVQGTPAKHIPAELEKLDNPDTWRTIGNGTTNDDGRIDNLIGEKRTTGMYRYIYVPIYMNIYI